VSIEEEFLLSVAARDVQQILSGVSRWKPHSSHIQQALFNQLCLNNIREVFRIDSWQILIQSATVFSSSIYLVPLLFLGIAFDCNVPQLLEEGQILEFEAIDEDVQRVRRLETSLQPSAKSSLQLAAEYMSLGKLGR